MAKLNEKKLKDKKLKEKPYQHELRGSTVSWSPCRNGSRPKRSRDHPSSSKESSRRQAGTIKRITERVSPRVFRVVALPAPTVREKSQMYIQRYMAHFPAAGEVVIFDRSWYNRAGVERVMGFCTEEQTTRFLRLVPDTERAIVDSGVVLIKYWLEVSTEVLNTDG